MLSLARHAGPDRSACPMVSRSHRRHRRHPGARRVGAGADLRGLALQQLTAELGIEPLGLNTAYTLATLAAALPLTLTGKLTDRLGPRRTLALVAVAFGLGCAAMASAVGTVTVFAGFFLVRFLGQGSLTLVAHHAVAMWFHRRLGRMHALMQVALFGVWIGVPAATIALIGALGWRTTYLVYGLGVALLVAPLALTLIRDRPEDVGLTLDDQSGDEQEDEVSFTLAEARRTRGYWILVAITFLPPLISTALIFDMQPMLAALGAGAASSAIPITAWTATTATLALPAGWLTDRLAPAPLLAAGALGIALGCALVWRASSVSSMTAAMVVVAASQVLVSSVGPATVARFFGRAHHGVIRASISRITVIGTGIGPLATGLSAHLTGGYAAATIAFALACLPVAVAALRLRVPSVEAPALRRSA